MQSLNEGHPVTLINILDNKLDSVLKKMENENSAAIRGSLCISTLQMCDKKYRRKGMYKTKEARRYRTPSKRPKESPMFTNTEDDMDARASYQGCYCCA